MKAASLSGVRARSGSKPGHSSMEEMVVSQSFTGFILLYIIITY